MGFFKRLFGLGSKPAGDWIARLLGSPSMPGPVATDWASVETSNLPKPPDGFTWHVFKEARLTVLRPEGWHVHQVMDDKVFVGCISKECIQTEGRFRTGLTLNVFRATKDGLRQHNPDFHPDVPIVGTLELKYPGLPSAPGFEIRSFDQSVQRTASSRLFRLQYHSDGATGAGYAYLSQAFIIEFDQSPDVYDFTFESPESTWNDAWKIGKQILTNLVFSPGPSKGLIFSIDPPLPSDDFLKAKALDVGRSLGWPLEHEDRAHGLFTWRIELEVARKRQPPSKHAGTFTWFMQRLNNEIKLYDPVDLVTSHEPSVDFTGAVDAAARQLQEDFKRRWSALVGPVTLQPASPEMVELCLKRAAARVSQAQGTPSKA